MVPAIGRLPVTRKVTFTSNRLKPSCSYVPDYSSPDPSKLSQQRKQLPGPTPLPSSPTKTTKRFWEYKAPSASIGSPDGYQLSSVTIPQYGDGGNGGSSGGGGSGGGGGGGGGGDPMKGFTYLFALALFAAGMSAYIRKGSSKSLLISSAVAVLLLVSASLMGHPTYRVGTQLALATCLTLAGAMGYRAKASGKLLPGGAVAALSLLMSAGYVATLV